MDMVMFYLWYPREKVRAAPWDNLQGGPKEREKAPCLDRCLQYILAGEGVPGPLDIGARAIWMWEPATPWPCLPMGLRDGQVRDVKTLGVQQRDQGPVRSMAVVKGTRVSVGGVTCGEVP